MHIHHHLILSISKQKRKLDDGSHTSLQKKGRRSTMVNPIEYSVILIYMVFAELFYMLSILYHLLRIGVKMLSLMVDQIAPVLFTQNR